tara:strand:- start:249 stop:488 length:240 start_codon:yes stop_codon:yes gene_type:complete
MDLFGHTIPKKGDLIRCRHRFLQGLRSASYYTKVSLGIVLWQKDDYFKICLQSGSFIFAHKDELEVVSRESPPSKRLVE